MEDAPRPSPPFRRATTNDLYQENHAVPEDEDRGRLSSGSPSRAEPGWQRRYYAQTQPREVQPSPPLPPLEEKRPTAMKRLTGLIGNTEDGQLRRHRLKNDRGTSMSAQKWRQIKQQLRLLAQKRGRDRTIDHEKSAELLAELTAGSPAALMLASMFQRDEHGSRRVPVLLEQLKVRVVDTEYDSRFKENDPQTQSDRRVNFYVDLEYGNGLHRMKWTIRRSLRDFTNLHIKYKLHFSTQRYVRLKVGDDKGMPHFPKSAYPYLKNVRGMEDEVEDEDEELGHDTDGGAAGADRPIQQNRKRSSIGHIRRRSLFGGAQDEASGPGTPARANSLANVGLSAASKRDIFQEKQRRKLEVYLQRMIKFMLFRADSNRLCKFLEVSALGMRLAAEGGFHGKEGFLIIQSSKGLDFRKALTPVQFKRRHTPKWFLVRHSYVVCVESPEEMNIYDVFLFDEDFVIQPQSFLRSEGKDKSQSKQIALAAKESASHPQHYRLKIQNSERKMNLLARNERQLGQFEDSIRTVVNSSQWTKPNRFQSFAPVRKNCFAQWLVDGRDHMWVVSRAINQAKDVIYIHDWWLSPELYMRRPPAISQHWRLDRLLKRKAEQGVKVFVIVYRNVETAIPIDSQYTKFSLLELHPNVFVQRSPNQFRQNTFFWAHHEKVCIVDHTLAFVGGIDLCFGRWDTPQHIVTDDKPTGFEPSDLPKDTDHCQLWPGKDYSNPRVQDFFALNKPYEEMYDRSVVARSPWHDISMQVVGQPARDLTRHFVQRWNYILRQRKPTRPTPFLLPPPDFNPADLEALDLDGTCEVQILRSCGPWSIGTPNKTEHSIMTAYAKMIEESEHFVYMENQFFISSCVTDVITIKNSIGDALVERVVRAAKNDEAWRAMIVIPLMPGFQNTVDSEGGTSVRLIMQYQYRSICRGESSIFGRLRAQNIEPEDYIQFYSLRAWGKIGPHQRLVTEQLYVHAKCMIVDDRVAIIGSANINERSMLGNRDSEVAAIVRDTDMIWSRMNGHPYMVGRFPNSLRMRLMREHLGLDVDQIMEDAQMVAQGKDGKQAPNSSPMAEDENAASYYRSPPEELISRTEDFYSFNHDVDWEQAENPNLITNRKLTEDSRVTGNPVHLKDVEGEGRDNMKKIEELGWRGGRDTQIVKETKEVLTTGLDTEGKHSLQAPLSRGEVAESAALIAEKEIANPPLPSRPQEDRSSTFQPELPLPAQLPALPATDDSDIGGPALVKPPSRNGFDNTHPLLHELRPPDVDKDCMQDPVIDAFAIDTWHAVAENNSKLFRAVFRCMPDNEVKDWKEYKEYVAYTERFEAMQGGDERKPGVQPHKNGIHHSGPPGAGLSDRKLHTIGRRTSTDGSNVGSHLRERGKHARRGTSEEDSAQKDKEELRAWAIEANKAQVGRQQSQSSHRYSASGGPGYTSPTTTAAESSPAPPSPGADERDVVSDLGLSTSNTEMPSSEKEKQGVQFVGYSGSVNMNGAQNSTTRRRRRGTARSSRKGFTATDDIPTKAEAEGLLDAVQGHLIVWPYDW